MQQLYIDKEHIFEFVRVSKMPLEKDAYLRSRCVDGRYESAPDLPAFGFPGADAGELFLLIASAHAYGFEFDHEKAFSALAKLLGGAKHMQFHTDEHAASPEPLAGCGHVGQIRSSPQDYWIEQEDIEKVQALMKRAQKEGAQQVVLRGEHAEGVVILAKGTYGVLPQADILVDNRRHHVQAFIYHQTLADTRHKLFAKMLIEEGAVTLPEGCDESYLYQVFADMAENHLMETLKRLAKGLPIYEIIFDKDGLFEIEDMGTV